MLGDSRWCFVDDLGQIAYRQLVVAVEGEDNTHTGGVGKEGEYFGGEFNVFGVRVKPAKVRIFAHTRILTQGHMLAIKFFLEGQRDYAGVTWTEVAIGVLNSSVWSSCRTVISPVDDIATST